MKPILVEFFLKRQADKLFRRIAKFLRIGGGQFWAWTFPVMLQVTQILFADAELLRECRHGHLFRLTDCRKQMTKPELRARDFFKRFERALRHCAFISHVCCSHRFCHIGYFDVHQWCKWLDRRGSDESSVGSDACLLKVHRDSQEFYVLPSNRDVRRHQSTLAA